MFTTRAFKQRRSKPELQSMTSRQISSGLDLTYAPSTITSQQPTEGELDLLFEAMYDDFIGGQPSAAQRTVPVIQAQQDVDELHSQQQHAQQQESQAHLQSETIAEDVPNSIFDANTFVNPFANPSISAAESSSSQNVDPSNMHTFYQPHPHEFQWTKDHPLEQVIREPSRPVLTRNQLRSDGDMYMYALTVSTMEILLESTSNRSASWKPCQGGSSKLNLPGHRYRSDDGVTISFQRSRNSRPPMLDHQDKYMIKAQVHVSKSSAISDIQALPRKKYFYYQVVKQVLRGTLLASFQDLEHEGGDTRIVRRHEFQG
nr:hypothetical protein [Tanacetum cinerariifolium]